MLFYKETDLKEEPMIGKVASDWEAVKLEESLLLLRNGLTTTQNKEGDGYSVTRIETISEEDIDPSKVGYIYDLSESKMNEYRLRDGDVLFSHINSLDHIGKTAIYEEKPKLLFHGMNLLLLRPDKERIHPRFLLYLLRLYRMKNIFRAMAKKAVNQASINQTELGRVKILRPPLDEQLGIVGVLGVVDLAVQKAGEVIAKTERLKKGLMQTLLTRGMGHKEYKQTPIGTIPKEWDVVQYDKANERVFVGIATSSTKHFATEGVPLLRNQNIKETGIDLSDLVFIKRDFSEANRSRMLRENDILTVRTGFTGLSCKVTKEMEGWHTFTTLISRPDLTQFDPDYLVYFLNSPICKVQIARLQAGLAQQNLNVSWIIKLKVLKPAKDEQTKIAEGLKTVDNKLQVEKAYLAKLATIKRGLMDALLTGKVRVKVD